MFILAVEFYHDFILYSVYVSKSLRHASTMSCPYSHLFGVHVANSLRQRPPPPPPPIKINVMNLNYMMYNKNVFNYLKLFKLNGVHIAKSFCHPPSHFRRRNKMHAPPYPPLFPIEKKHRDF